MEKTVVLATPFCSYSNYTDLKLIIISPRGFYLSNEADVSALKIYAVWYQF